MKTIRSIPVFSLFLISFMQCSESMAQKLKDTIFYNDGWKICERPIASYYRISTLAIDSFWFFTGPVNDYNIDNHSPMMEGNYTIDGYKNGRFTFYYPNGKIAVTGNYIHDKMSGIWQYYYEDGGERATIAFNGNPDDFAFVKYVSEKGKVELEKGTGNFTWRQNELDYARNDVWEYTLTGQFKDTLRDDVWKYYLGETMDMNTLRFKEKYKNGKLVKARDISYYGNNKAENGARVTLHFEPGKIRTTENIEYDEFFKKFDSSGRKNDQTLVNYLVGGQTPEIPVKEKEFTKAFSSVLSTLDRYRNKIDYHDKDIEGTVEFRVADEGHLKEIKVTGNISDKEKNFIAYIMSKFRNIEMPLLDSTIALDSYHSLYFFTYNPRKLVPVDIRDYVPKDDFIFCTIPREKFMSYAKDFKDIFRKMMNRL